MGIAWPGFMCVVCDQVEHVFVVDPFVAVVVLHVMPAPKPLQSAFVEQPGKQ
jgi:hypothetical protein